MLNALVCLVTLRQPSSVLPSNKDLFGRSGGRRKKERKEGRYAQRIPSSCIAACCSDLTLSGCSPDVSPPVRIARRWSVRRAVVTSRPKQRRSAYVMRNGSRPDAQPKRARLSPPRRCRESSANTGAIIHNRDGRSRSLAFLR